MKIRDRLKKLHEPWSIGSSDAVAIASEVLDAQRNFVADGCASVGLDTQVQIYHHLPAHVAMVLLGDISRTQERPVDFISRVSEFSANALSNKDNYANSRLIDSCATHLSRMAWLASDIHHCHIKSVTSEARIAMLHAIAEGLDDYHHSEKKGK